MQPPEYIDGAKVLKWAWSGLKPFGMQSTVHDRKTYEIYGLAICQYQNSEIIYRFSCNNEWKTQNDGVHKTVEDAIKFLPEQYKNVEAIWHSWESGDSQ